MKENIIDKTTKQLQAQTRQKWRDANVKISKELRDIIHGYIMSDGYVSPSGSLQVDQSLAQQKFVEWLYEKLAPVRTDTPISDVTRTDVRTGSKTFSKRFFTRTLLKGFRNMWYKQDTSVSTHPSSSSAAVHKDMWAGQLDCTACRRGTLGLIGKVKYIKRLPQSIKCFFNSITITLWFAGDGSNRTDCQGANIEVTAFTTAERLTLKKLFKQKFGIPVQINKAGVSKAGTPQWNLAINADNYQKFRKLITQMDLIPKIFPYKLHKKN
jgi:hypothetical protein